MVAKLADYPKVPQSLVGIQPEDHGYSLQTLGAGVKLLPKTHFCGRDSISSGCRFQSLSLRCGYYGRRMHHFLLCFDLTYLNAADLGRIMPMFSLLSAPVERWELASISTDLF
jgi:hypothetical protein